MLAYTYKDTILYLIVLYISDNEIQCLTIKLFFAIFLALVRAKYIVIMYYRPSAYSSPEPAGRPEQSKLLQDDLKNLSGQIDGYLLRWGSAHGFMHYGHQDTNSIHYAGAWSWKRM